jgi:tetratricopeptide (TPR) repeat protein
MDRVSIRCDGRWRAAPAKRRNPAHERAQTGKRPTSGRSHATPVARPANRMTGTGALHTQGRNAGLSEAALRLLRQAGVAIKEGRLDAAEEALAGACALMPSHPEVKRMRGVLLSRTGRFQDAIATLQPLLDATPGDPLLLNDLASALYGAGSTDDAFAMWQRACEIAPDFAVAWFNYGKNRKSEGDVENAIPLLERAIALDPDTPATRVILGDALTYAGRIEDAIAHFRAALRMRPDFGAAWWGLASIKTVSLSARDVETLESIWRADGLADADRIPIGFALGKAHEDAGRYSAAFSAYSEANALMRRSTPWDPTAFSAQIDAILDPGNQPTAQASPAALGSEVILIVSLPRSGSTLTEQILAAHPEVEGASELPTLGKVIREESQRRRREFPEWMPEATADEWERLGRDYLARTARWRERKPRFTDKMPNNWPFLGAALAMLPGARVVDCRRDPVETGWSCFKQLFATGQKFTYDFDSLAAMWKDYVRAMNFWKRGAPNRVRTQVYEEFLANPEAETRALLDFCGLPFDPACLRYYEASRVVRTASAAQVREPPRADTARAARYGNLLDPLRNGLLRDDART